MGYLLCRLFGFKDQCFHMKLKLFFFFFGEVIVSPNWKAFHKSSKREFYAKEKLGNSLGDFTQFERALWLFNSYN